MRITLYLLIAASLCSCGSFREKFGRRAGETLVTFKAGGEHNPASNVYPMNGGVWIILKSESGTDFMKSVFIPNEAAPVQMAVPNGIYKAGAIAWEGNGSPPCTPGVNCFPGQGQAKCDIAFNDTSFPLTGAAITVPFVLTQAKCQNPPNGPTFSDVAYNPTSDTNFPAITFHFTSGSTYNTGAYRGLLTLNMQTKTANGSVIHQRVRLSCTGVAGGFVTTGQNMPVGKVGDSIFSYTLTMHTSGDSTCAAAPTGIFEFSNGLASPPTSPTHTVSSYSISYATQVNTVTLIVN